MLYRAATRSWYMLLVISHSVQCKVRIWFETHSKCSKMLSHHAQKIRKWLSYFSDKNKAFSNSFYPFCGEEKKNPFLSDFNYHKKWLIFRIEEKNAFSWWNRLNSSHTFQIKRLRCVYFQARIFHSMETLYSDSKTRKSILGKNILYWSSFWGWIYLKKSSVCQLCCLNKNIQHAMCAN